MKKMISVIAAVLAVAGVARAEMDQKVFGGAISGTGTNSSTASFKGLIQSIVVTIPTVYTSSVNIVDSDGQVIFNHAGLTSATDGTFYPRVNQCANDLAATNTTTVLQPYSVVGTVTTKFIGIVAGTNGDVFVKINYEK